MRSVQRILVGVAALLSLLTALQLWFNMDAALTNFGVSPLNLVGRQTVRADMAGLFLGSAIFAGMAAWRTSASWATGALVMMGSAIAGRLVGIAIDGTGPGVWPPIVVEAVLIALLLWVRRSWKG